MQTITRRAALSHAVALAAVSVVPNGNAAPLSDDLRAAALSLGAAVDRFRATTEAWERLSGDPAASSAFEDDEWEPAYEALRSAERRVLETMEASGVGAVAVRGRLYVNTSAGAVADRHGVGLETVSLIPVGEVVSL